MAKHYTWHIGNVALNVVKASLFDVDAVAIVNSEQTDFILAPPSQNSVSAQISRRWGNRIQSQLDSLTKGLILPTGTVLETDAPPYRYIFHAGFHLPHQFRTSEDWETEHLKVIRSCVRRILERSVSLRLPTVAFPLIGTGVFGLNPALLASIFFDELLIFTTDAQPAEKLNVYLTTIDEGIFDEIVQVGIQAWIDRLHTPPNWDYFKLGIHFIDAFEIQLAKIRDFQWKAFRVTQYAELITFYIFSVIACSDTPPFGYENFVAMDQLISFGRIRDEAMKLSQKVSPSDSKPWAGFLLKNMGSNQRWQCMVRINEDRNDIAHKRAFRPYTQILDDLKAFVCLDNWHSFAKNEPLPCLSGLSPWVCSDMAGGNQGEKCKADRYGLLERWSGAKRTYLNPTNGKYFFIPR